MEGKEGKIGRKWLSFFTTIGKNESGLKRKISPFHDPHVQGKEGDGKRKGKADATIPVHWSKRATRFLRGAKACSGTRYNRSIL